MSRVPLQPVRRTDIKIGSPLPYPVYDAQGRLLLKAGEIIRTDHQLTMLHEQGMYSQGAPLTRSLRRPDPVESSPEPAEAEAEPDTAPQTRRLSELKLSPGKTLYVDFLSAANRPRVALRLIGFIEGGGVLISALNAEGHVVPFRDNELLFVRVLTASGVATFESKVLKVHFTPFPYVVTSFPELAVFSVMRQHERIDTDLICTAANLDRFVREGSSDSLPALMKNLSASGCQIEAGPSLAEVGERVRLGFKLEAAGEEHVLSLVAAVRGVKPFGEPGQRRFGLQFEELGMGERLVVEHYIFHALIGD